MDPKQTPPRVDNSGITSDSASLSATGQSVFANPQNRFKDTNPQGDILIPASTPGKSRKPVNKPLLIGIVAVVVIAIVAGILVMTLGSNGGGGKTSGGGNKVANADLDDYIEYFVYGTEGESEVSDATFTIDADEYAVWLESNDQGDLPEDEYYSVLSDKINALAATDEDKYSSQANLLAAFWLSSQLLDSSLIVDYYIDESSDELKAMIDEISDYNTEWSAESATIMNNYLSSELSRFQTLKDNGCLDEEGILENCYENQTDAFSSSLFSDETQSTALSDLNFKLYGQLTDSLKTLYFGEDENA